MATSVSLIFSLCFLVLCHGAIAQFGIGGQSAWHSSRSFGDPRGCRFESFDRLDALNPSRRVPSEAGVTEYYEESNEMLRCAGVSLKRYTMEPRGLLLPTYHNAPSLIYITQGRGLISTIFPGCPESFQSFQQEAEQYLQGTVSESQQRLRDEHQKVRRFQQGDIIALPAGVTFWCYNDGDIPMVAVHVFDTSNTANQLEPMHRCFHLAGRFQSVEPMDEMGRRSLRTTQQLSNNVFNGFDTQMLAEALGVNPELVRRLQSQNDPRGEIVFVKEGLQMLRPSRSQEVQQQEFEESMERQQFGKSIYGPQNTTNGLDETFCTMKIRSNIDIPSRADYFNQRGSRVAILNSQKLPILNLVQMSASRVVLQRNSMITPYWHINCHSLMYVTGGQGRVQVVNHRGKTVFDGTLNRGQIILIPQNFVVLKRAEREMFQWVSFNTNHNAMRSQIVGKSSVLRAMPLQVLMHSYRLSMEQARRLKFSRQQEMTILSPMYEERSMSDVSDESVTQ